MYNVLNSETIRIINHTITSTSGGTVRGFLLGAGLFYSIQNGKYLHIPIILFFPVPYAGYQLFKNKTDLILDISRSLRALR
jgi:hypothetical protein